MKILTIIFGSHELFPTLNEQNISKYYLDSKKAFRKSFKSSTEIYLFMIQEFDWCLVKRFKRTSFLNMFVLGNVCCFTLQTIFSQLQAYQKHSTKILLTFFCFFTSIRFYFIKRNQLYIKRKWKIRAHLKCNPFTVRYFRKCCLLYTGINSVLFLEYFPDGNKNPCRDINILWNVVFK